MSGLNYQGFVGSWKMRACCLLLIGTLGSSDADGNEKVIKTIGNKAPSTRIRRFWYPQIFLCGYKNICVHTQRIRIVYDRPHVSDSYPDISKDQSNLERKKTGSDTVTSAYTKIYNTSVHTYPDTQRIQKFSLWRAYTEISGYIERIRRTLSLIHI